MKHTLKEKELTGESRAKSTVKGCRVKHRCEGSGGGGVQVLVHNLVSELARQRGSKVATRSGIAQPVRGSERYGAGSVACLQIIEVDETVESHTRNDTKNLLK